MKLSFLGDVAFSQETANTWVDPEVATHLKSNLTFANLECVFSDTSSTTDQLALCAPTSAVELLVRAGIDVVSLANNHTMDLGQSGLASTVAALDSAGVRHVGAGDCEDTALKALVIEAEQHKIGIVARIDAQSFLQDTGIANGKTGGAARFCLEETMETGRALRTDKGCDITVCLMHWGIQGVPILPAWLRDPLTHLLSRFDVVSGSHAHVLYGITQQKQRLGVCGLGNFYFEPFCYHGRWLYRKVSVSRLSMVVDAELCATGGWKSSAHPTWQRVSDNNVVFLGGLSRQLIRFIVRFAPTRSRFLFELLWRAKEIKGLIFYTIRNPRALLKRNPVRRLIEAIARPDVR